MLIVVVVAELVADLFFPPAPNLVLKIFRWLVLHNKPTSASTNWATSKPAAHDYAIGNGDLLSISVFDVPELCRDLRVSQSGTISVPLVPTRREVSGLTEIQAQRKIAEVLKQMDW